jgi:hypothetical protein
MVQQVANAGGNFRASRDSNQRPRDLGRLPFLGECTDDQVRFAFFFGIPHGRAHFEVNAQHAIAKSTGWNAVVID